MQNKKMTNPTDGINESNKKLRAIYEQLCCLTSAVEGSYNALDSYALADGADITFSPGDIHSFAWELATDATVEIDSGSTVNTFSTNGNITFSTLNSQTITITAVGGAVTLLCTRI